MPLEIENSLKKEQDRLKLEAEINQKGATGKIGKTWDNGWGFFTYVKTVYKEWKNTEVGVKITKE